MRYLSLSVIGLLLLAGCVQASDPAAQLPTSQDVQQVAETDVPTRVLLTETTQPKPEEQFTAQVEPTAETSPEPTLLPCPGKLTSPNQEGPYYSPGSPERASLVDEGMPGTIILIVGRVFDQECNPIPGAKLDFWLADVDGVYDNIGYRLRGHVFSDERGYYEIETIEPGLYTGRPPHIHVKAFAPDGRELLTTQIYFPGSEGSGDVVAAPDLLATYLAPDADGRQIVLFTFVVPY